MVKLVGRWRCGCGADDNSTASNDYLGRIVYARKAMCINGLACNGWNDKVPRFFVGTIFFWNLIGIFFKGIATVELHMDYSAKSIRRCKD
jgi:hypothetical protein